MEGVTLINSKVKVSLLRRLSQLIDVPLELVEGAIAEVKLTHPWDKILKNKDAPLVFTLKGVQVRAKLPEELDRAYALEQRADQLRKLTLLLTGEQQPTSKSGWLGGKVKEMLLRKVVLSF